MTSSISAKPLRCEIYQDATREARACVLRCKEPAACTLIAVSYTTKAKIDVCFSPEGIIAPVRA